MIENANNGVENSKESNGKTSDSIKSISYEDSQNQSLIIDDIQSLIIKILVNDNSVSKEEKEHVKGMILSKGLYPFFYTPEELFPTEDLDESDDDGEYDTEYDIIEKKLDKFEYIDIYYDEMQMYLRSKLRKIQTVEDLRPMIKLIAKLYNVFIQNEHEACLSLLLQFIGDLFFSLEEYDKALLCYDKAMQYAEPYEYDLLSNAIFTVLYKLKKIPSVRYFVQFVDQLVLTESYLDNRLKAEYEDNYNDFFEWAFSEGKSNIPYSNRDKECGVFDCTMTSINEGTSIRKKLNLSSQTFISVHEMKAIIEFGQTINSDNTACIKLLKEITNKNKILSIWNDTLNWCRKLKRLLPEDEIVIHYRTPWLWKFHLDLFFPKRQLAIVFKEGAELSEDEFKDGRVGMIQYNKEFARALKKAETRYGIRIIQISLNHPQDQLYDLLTGKIGE